MAATLEAAAQRIGSHHKAGSAARARVTSPWTLQESERFTLAILSFYPTHLGCPLATYQIVFGNVVPCPPSRAVFSQARAGEGGLSRISSYVPLTVDVGLPTCHDKSSGFLLRRRAGIDLFSYGDRPTAAVRGTKPLTCAHRSTGADRASEHVVRPPALKAK